MENQRPVCFPNLSCQLALIFHSRNLAALGAALTILSLAFDTFTQQVLAIDSRNVANDPTQAETTPNALLPRVVNYTGASTPAPNPGMSPAT